MGGEVGTGRPFGDEEEVQSCLKCEYLSLEGNVGISWNLTRGNYKNDGGNIER